MQQHDCVNSDKIIYMKDYIEKLNLQIQRQEEKIQELEISSKEQKVIINNIAENVKDMMAKLTRFNTYLIANLVSIICLTISGIGMLAYFIITGGVAK